MTSREIILAVAGAAPVVLVPLRILLGLLHSRLFFLLSQFHSLLLLPRGELALRADKEAARMPDGKDEQGDHHGEAVEGVGVLLVEGNGVGGRVNTLGELNETEDDTDLAPPR
jgi:hypothetical protein